MGNISDAESTFRGLAQQDYQAKQEKNANVLNLYNTLEGTDYSRNRDTVGDYKNYLNLLASRYSTDRQANTAFAFSVLPLFFSAFAFAFSAAF